MKKISILLLSALALGVATSCDDEPAKAVPQHNEQMPLFVTGDVAAAVAGPVAEGTVTLQNYNAEEATIPVVAVSKAEGMPAGATVSFGFQVADNPEFENGSELTATLGADGMAHVDANLLNDIHVNLFGKSPLPKTVYYRIPGYVTLDQTNYRIGSPDLYYGSGSYQETCFDMGFTISTGYYLLGNATTWDLAMAAPYAFSHSEADVYDDPVFTYVFEISQSIIDANGGCYWKLASKEAVEKNSWDYTYGVAKDGDTALEGHLVDVNPQAGKIEAAGRYKFTINMEQMTYLIEPMNRPDYMSTPNNGNGWSFTNNLAYDEGRGLFYGVDNVDLIWGFKFGYEKNGNQVWCGDSGTPGIYADGEGGNIMEGKTELNGLMWFTANYETHAYTAAKVDVISLIGLNGDWNADVDMTPSADNLVWTVTVPVTSATEWKFRVNHAWDYDLGGPLDALGWGIGNCASVPEGTYTFTLDLRQLPYRATVSK